jgi:hypothetical protein
MRTRPILTAVLPLILALSLAGPAAAAPGGSSAARLLQAYEKDFWDAVAQN